MPLKHVGSINIVYNTKMIKLWVLSVRIDWKFRAISINIPQIFVHTLTLTFFAVSSCCSVFSCLVSNDISCSVKLLFSAVILRTTSFLSLSSLVRLYKATHLLCNPIFDQYIQHVEYLKLKIPQIHTSSKSQQLFLP